MEMTDCFYCTKDKRLSELMQPVCRLQWSDVYFLRDQRYRGRCVVACKRHVNELYEMEEAERRGFWEEVSAAALAVSRIYHPDKLNYAVYGDLVSHYHVHLVPKYKGGAEWGIPFTDAAEKKYLPQENMDFEIQQLKEELQKIKAEKG